MLADESNERIQFPFERFSQLCKSVHVVILVPMIAIILEKEMGSALVFLAFSLMLYREGLPEVGAAIRIFMRAAFGI